MRWTSFGNDEWSSQSSKMKANIWNIRKKVRDIWIDRSTDGRYTASIVLVHQLKASHTHTHTATSMCNMSGGIAGAVSASCIPVNRLAASKPRKKPSTHIPSLSWGHFSIPTEGVVGNWRCCRLFIESTFASHIRSSSHIRFLLHVDYTEEKVLPTRPSGTT